MLIFDIYFRISLKVSPIKGYLLLNIDFRFRRLADMFVDEVAVDADDADIKLNVVVILKGFACDVMESNIIFRCYSLKFCKKKTNFEFY